MSDRSQRIAALLAAAREHPGALDWRLGGVMIQRHGLSETEDFVASGSPIAPIACQRRQ